MIYREWLVMRKAIPVYLAIVLALFVVLTITSRASTTFVQCMNAGAWFGALFASIFGVALGNSSREGARVYWVLPTSRWQSALGIVAVDLLGTLTVTMAFSLAVGGIYSVAASMPGNSMKWIFDWNAALLMASLPVAVYAWAALIGMIGRRLAYIGIATMPVLVLWFAFAQAPGAIGKALSTPIPINPFAVYLMATSAGRHAGDHSALTAALAWVTPQTGLIALVIIMIVGCASAIAMWSKTEVLA
jgi:hypothetical protein